MNCSCGKASYLSPVMYIAGANGSHMACDYCDASIHFGPAVAALRDRADVALDNEVVTSLAWYHTSTSADWPSPEFASRFAQGLSWIERDFGISRERFIAEHTSKALHVGTYEAAIENMLRRMNNQGDRSSQFYLYRVSLCLNPGRINPGYRDENHEIAADISVSDLDSDGLDAVRYLNVQEAMGVLSLAVRPGAIAAVQRAEIPLDGIAMPVDPRAVQSRVDDVYSAAVELTKAKSTTSTLNHVELRMMQLGARPDPNGLAKRVGEIELRLYDNWQQLEQRLEEICLPNVSAVVRRDFNDAIARWRPDNSRDDIHDFIERYRSMAALLEKSADVIEALSDQPWRPVHTH